MSRADVRECSQSPERRPSNTLLPVRSDGDAVEKLRQEGVTGERWVRHDFTFFGNARGAADAAAELRRLAFDPVIADEEVSADGYWHVAAFSVSRLQAESFARQSKTLENLAWQFGGGRQSDSRGFERREKGRPAAAAGPPDRQARRPRAPKNTSRSVPHQSL